MAVIGGRLQLNRTTQAAVQQAYESLRCRIDAGLVTGRHQIEQQAPGDGQPEPCHRGIDCTAGKGRDLGEPAVDGAGNHTGKRLFALGRPRVALEEKPFELTQIGATKVGPHGGKALGRICGQFRKKSHLAALDLLDDRHEEIFSRPEVVQQHSVAGAHRSGDVAQGAVADAARRELVDERIEQLPAAL
jgi:hypothetical protein